MANDHTKNSLSPILGPRVDVTSRSTRTPLGPVADDVASTPAGPRLKRRAVRGRPRKAVRQDERSSHQLVRRRPCKVPTAHDATRRT